MERCRHRRKTSYQLLVAARHTQEATQLGLILEVRDSFDDT